MSKSILIALATLIGAATSAAAQTPTPAAGPMCAERGTVVSFLKQQYGETQEDSRLQSDQALIELFASEKGTWSILLSRPNGTSCVVAAGKDLAQQAGI